MESIEIFPILVDSINEEQIAHRAEDDPINARLYTPVLLRREDARRKRYSQFYDRGARVQKEDRYGLLLERHAGISP